MTDVRRRLLSRAAAIAAVLSLLVGIVTLYAERTLFDPDRFADRAVSVLDDEAVANEAASAIADAAVEEVPDAIAARPVIEGVAAALVSSRAVQSVLAAGVADLHATTVKGDQDTILLTLADVGVLLREALETTAPQIAEQIPRGLDAELVSGGEGGEAVLVDAGQIAEDLEPLPWAGALAFVLSAVLSIALAVTRLEGVRRIGRTVAGGGVAAVALWLLARVELTRELEGPDSDAVAAIYDAFLVDLRSWLLLCSGVGLVIAAAATSTRKPVAIEDTLLAAWGWLTRVPDGLALRGLRAVALIATGAVVIFQPTLALQLAAVLAGGYLVYAGATELMRLAAGAVSADQRRRAETGESTRRQPGLRRGVAVAVSGAVLVGAMVGLAAASDTDERPPFELEACNGDVELCDRPLDQVAFAATHNSMSAATYPNWFFAQHEKGIGEQLDAGVRALLIDPHYGVKTPRGVYTDLEADTSSREKIEAGLGRRGVEAAERLRQRIGYEGGGKTEVFLCHGFCEVGAIRAVDGFREIRDFLLANPSEVVIVSIEDATSPEDTVAVIEDAGLGDLVYKGPNGPAWPTLRELIESGQRLLVMAERDGGEPSWYRRQFEITQETPFRFERAEELRERSSCEPNRGPSDAPFFLLNNWVDTSPAPRPTNAKKVNTKQFLLQRIRRCTRIRGTEPNIIAVDFFAQGDVVGAVEELNGEG